MIHRIARKGARAAFAAAAALCAGAGALAAPGDVIENTAFLTRPDGTVAATNPAVFTVGTRRTDSTIEFLSLAAETCAPMDVAPTQLAGPRARANQAETGPDVLPARTLGGAAVDLTGAVCLGPTETYEVGELIFVFVADAGQNADPSVRETALVTITTPGGDAVTLVITETGPDTGVFVGYVPSAGAPTEANDGVLSIGDGTVLTATYQDAFDAEETSVDTAGVARGPRVFDSVTGAPVDGAVVTIIDAATGRPATVPGPLGTGGWPASVTTGGTVSGPDGTMTLAPGGFRFPMLPDGEYLLRIEPPEGYRAPSVLGPDARVADYVLGAGSFLGAFTVVGGGIGFDVPLDPAGTVTLTKRARTATARVGGLVAYQIEVGNTGAVAALVSLRDTLPRGFRFEAGTMRVGGRALDVQDAGGALSIGVGVVGAGETATLTYTARVTGEAEAGGAVNSVVAVDGAGAAVSNVARARVEVEEDRLAVRTQILGRVAADRCDPQADWPREIVDGVGVPGVRLLMETGAYVVTDRDGLYSFPDVSPRAHVVRLDEASLPEGYELVACERTTRSAHEPHSRFVDAQGGMVWEADFSVRRVDGLATATDAFEAAQDGFDAVVADPVRDHDEFGLAWLDAQAPGVSFAYPAEGVVPDIASLDFGLLHPRGAEVEVHVNGVPVDYVHMAERTNSTDRTMALSSFRGVSLEEGENRLSAVARDAETKLELGRATRAVWFVREAARAEVLEERSELLADGRSIPVIAVRLTDAGGRPIHTGRLVEVAVEPPHGLLERVVAEEIMPIGTPQLSGGRVAVGADGVMLVRLAPTTVSGLVALRVPTVSGERMVTAMLAPQAREWIVVGLGDGILGDPTNAVGVQDMENPRVAAYAQGTVGDGWLITGAVDTAKDDERESEELFRQVDPDDRYALYGDRSDQRFDAQSRFPVYLRAERGGTKAVVGDFDTAISETTLGRYERRLTGGHVTHRTQDTALTAFVAETDQVFRRDEIAADGTSGPYRATTDRIVVHSEIVAVETRDLFRPDVVLGLRTLTRFVDYDLDYDTGELVFTAPVKANESLYDTNVIVVSYEAESGQGGEASAGARAARQVGRARIGAGVVHEGGLGSANADGNASVAGGGDALLASADALVQVTDTTLVRAEIAVTQAEGRDDARAVLIEAEHASDRVVAKAWYRETEAGFGLGQQSTAALGARRYGAAGELRLGGPEAAPEDDASWGRSARYALRGQVSHQEEIGAPGAVSVAEASVVQETEDLRLQVGLRATEEVRGDREAESLMLTTALRRQFPEWGLAVTGSIDQPLGLNEGEAATLFPRRMAGELEKRLGDFATVTVGHEVLKANGERSANTTVGVRATPWTGAALSAGTDLLTTDGGRRVGATFGADQQVPLSERVTASLNVTRRIALGGDEDLLPVGVVARDAPVSPLEGSEEFLSAAAGLAYRTDGGVASGRVEVRDSALGVRTAQVLGVAREVSERASVAGAARFTQTDVDAGADRREGRVTLGGAWRPRGEGAIVLHRLDYDMTYIEDGLSTKSLAATTAVSMEPTRRLDLSVMHGVRFEETVQRFGQESGQQFGLDAATVGVPVYADALQQVAGLEARYDVTARVDVGARASVRYDHDDDALSYSYGPSVGVSPAEGVWLSVGYNVSGYEADGFAESEHTEHGPYVAARVAFDEGTARGLLNRLSRR